MGYTSWRGTLGCIKPTMRPGSLEELIRILPEGVGVIPLFLEIKEGTTSEFKRAVTPYEPLIAKRKLPVAHSVAAAAGWVLNV